MSSAEVILGAELDLKNCGDENISSEQSTKESFELGPPEDLLHKNTSSFRCLAQLEISRSSLLLDPFYWFPELVDPQLDNALWLDEPPPDYGNVGREKYLDACKKEGLRPYRRVLNSLKSNFLDLRFYVLNTKEMKTVCDTLAINQYVKYLSLQENALTLRSVKYIDEMLQKNTTVANLDLRECRMGPEGAQCIRHGFAFTKNLLELDLSFNDLGDEGTAWLAKALKKNKSIKKLNLSHNNMNDRALIVFAPVLEENYTIVDLDISWNYLFKAEGMTAFMDSLQENMSIKKLNLSWCGIGDKENMRPILNYIKSDTARLEYLDLSNNRITGIAVKMIKTGLKINENLVNLNVSSNPMMPSEVEFLANTFLESRDTPSALNVIDFSNIMVDKTFVKIRNQIRRKGATVKVGGILANFKIKGPNLKHVLLERARVVAMAQKKKKFRQDIGIFLICLPDQPSTRTEFVELMDAKNVKLDNDLLDLMLKTFVNEKKEIDPKQMKESYLELYPDTKPPEKKKKKKKGGDGKKRAEQASVRGAVVQAGEPTSQVESSLGEQLLTEQVAMNIVPSENWDSPQLILENISKLDVPLAE